MQASQQTEPTPVIITSNTNMCVVTDGNSKTFEHQQPLQDRMFKLELTYRLEPDFGKVTKREVKDFFAWATANEHRSHEFFVRKAVSSKRPTPEEYKSPEKRAWVSAGDSHSSETDDLIHFALRYKSKCSKHLGLDKMLFLCKICEKMNQDVNICLEHGAENYRMLSGGQICRKFASF